jgi:hypothetical protein
MSVEIVLGRTEEVPGKPFTDPARSAEDEKTLRELLEQERNQARVWAIDPSAPQDAVVRETAQEGHRRLLVVPDTQALLEARDPTVVGFFGRPRAAADESLLFGLETELVASMREYSGQGLLSYYDVEIVKGAYGNLILFATPEGPRRWSENPIHHRAVEISPANYYEIRLHQGAFPGRLLDGGALRLARTRYIDYTGQEPWRAVRELAS